MNPMALVGGALGTASWLASSNSGDTARLRDSDVGFQFMVMVAFGVVGEFQSLDGIAREVNTEPINEGGRTGGPHMLVKHGKEGTLSLKFGMMDRSYMWDWIETVRVGGDFRREVTIIQFNRAFSPVRNFQLTNAYPRRVKSGSLDAMNSGLPVDEIELAYEKVIPIIIPQSAEAALANVGGAISGMKLF